MPLALLISAYGVICYLGFNVAFLYAIGFLDSIVVPKAINDGELVGTTEALVINVALIGVFGLQHTIMARAKFKEVLTKVIPKAAERSTYVLMSSLALALIFWQWRPMPEAIWALDNPGAYVVRGVFYCGWVIVLLSTFMVDHFSLLGLKQVHDNYLNREEAPKGFMVRGFYKLVRHPIMVGLLITFWATPHLTHGHALFAGGMTFYIIVGLVFEERDLVKELGDDYRKYQEEVPKLIPIPKR